MRAQARLWATGPYVVLHTRSRRYGLWWFVHFLPQLLFLPASGMRWRPRVCAARPCTWSCSPNVALTKPKLATDGKSEQGGPCTLHPAPYHLHRVLSPPFHSSQNPGPNPDPISVSPHQRRSSAVHVPLRPAGTHAYVISPAGAHAARGRQKLQPYAQEVTTVCIEAVHIRLRRCGFVSPGCNPMHSRLQPMSPGARKLLEGCPRANYHVDVVRTRAATALRPRSRLRPCPRPHPGVSLRPSFAPDPTNCPHA